MNDLKFELNVEIKEDSIYYDRWIIHICIPNCAIHDSKFFIKDYPLIDCEPLDSYQSFSFNDELFKEISKLLINTTTRNFIVIPDMYKACDYYHFLHYSKFYDNVHPMNRNNKFFKMCFKGTQLEIYDKCVEISQTWLKNYFDFKDYYEEG